MSKVKGIGAVVVLAAAMAVAAPAALADSTVVHVNAAEGWITTTLWVEPGQTYAVSAVGRAYTTMPNGIFHPIPGTGSGRLGVSGPEGQTYVCTNGPALACALDGAPFGELVGSVAGATFPIGNAGAITVPTTAEGGYLELAVNDYLIYYSDNSGGYTVTLG